MKELVLITAMMLLLAGCTNNITAPVTQNNPGNATGVQPVVYVTTPPGSTAYNNEITVNMDVRNIVLKAPGGADIEGEGHLRIYVDNSPNYVICTTPTCKLTNVAPGPHTVKIQIHKNSGEIYIGTSPVTVNVNVVANATNVNVVANATNSS